MKYLITTVSLCLLSFFSFGQDPVFTQPSVGIATDNTAWIGRDSVGHFSSIVRGQWQNLSGGYITSYHQYHQLIKLLNGYIGVGYKRDIQFQTLYTNTTNLFYTQLININELQIRPSVQFSYEQKAIKNLLYFDPNDSLYYSTNNRKAYFYFDASIAALYKGLQVGFAAHQINQPNQSILMMGDSKFPIRYSAQLAYQLPFINKIKINPFATYNYQNGFKSLNIGVDVALKKYINFFVVNRVNSFVGAGIGFENRFFRLNYSYELTTNHLTNKVTGGSSEFSLNVKLWNWKVKSSSANSIFSR